MPFNNASETTPAFVGDLELEAQKVKLLEDIAYLSGKLNEYELQSLQIKNLESKISESFDVLENHQNQLLQVKSEIKFKQTDLDDIIQKVGQLHGKRQELEKLLVELQAHIASNKKVLSSSDQELNAEIGKKKEDLLFLGELIGKQQKILEDKVQLVEKGSKALGKIESDIEDSQKQLADLEFQIGGQQSNLKDLNIEILEDTEVKKVLKQEIAELEKRVIDNQKEAEKIIAVANLYKDDTIEELEKQQENLDQVAGDLSVRESWLNEKEETLKSTKAELEKFYNRKIPHVNF